MLQLSVQSLAEQLQSATKPAQLEQQAGSPKMDNAVNALLEQSQRGQLPGTLYGRLHSLATVPAAEDTIAVNAVLTELCNMVSIPSSILLLYQTNTAQQAQGEIAAQVVVARPAKLDMCP